MAAVAAGLRAGDVITAVGDQPVKDLHDFHAALWRRAPGDRVAIAVARSGRSLVLQAQLARDAARPLAGPAR